jgi:hypothetical protein
MSTFLIIVIAALVSSGLLFVILRWLGVLGTAAVAEAEDALEAEKAKKASH